MSKSPNRRIRINVQDKEKEIEEWVKEISENAKTLRSLTFVCDDDNSVAMDKGEASLFNQQRFMGILQAISYSEIPYFVALNTIKIVNLHVGLQETKLIMTLLQITAANKHSLTFRLELDCELSQEAFWFLLVHYYVQNNCCYENKDCNIKKSEWKPKTIKKLVLCGSGVIDSHMEQLDSIITSSSKIKHLAFWRTSMTCQGICALTKALCQNNNTIESLDLIGHGGNKVGFLGVAKAIAEMLNQNSTLLFLNLSNTNLGDEGVVSIAHSLMTKK